MDQGSQAGCRCDRVGGPFPKTGSKPVFLVLNPLVFPPANVQKSPFFDDRQHFAGIYFILVSKQNQ